jgi:hypothetical protein
MVVKHYLSTLLVGIGLSTAIGCAVDPPPAPNPPLSERQERGVLKCQKAITKLGASFVSLKLKNLEKCAVEVLDLQLDLENQHIMQAQFDAALPNIRRECQEKFGAIKAASTRLVDGIISACEPVQDLVLGANDPLLFQGLVAGSGFASVEEVAGFICGVKEFAVDFAVAFEMPRLHQLLSILGSEFVADGEFQSEAIFLPVLPLDSRCSAPVASSGAIMGRFLGIQH